MPRKLSKKELEAENRMLRSHGIGDNVTKFFQTLVKYGVLAYIFYIARDIAIAWAGKVTVARIDIDAKGGLSVDMNDGAEPVATTILSSCEYTVALAFFVAIASIGYGKAQAKLRRRVIERFHPYQEAEEKGLDQKRTTSSLTKTGDTRPEDQ